MKNLKAIKVDSDAIYFEKGIKLYSNHDQDCCENHYLDMSDLKIEDFEGLDFDLSNDDFFEKIPDYGIALKPNEGFPIRIPGYGSNNGYYSSNLELVLEIPNEQNKVFDITECQEWE